MVLVREVNTKYYFLIFGDELHLSNGNTKETKTVLAISTVNNRMRRDYGAQGAGYEADLKQTINCTATCASDTTCTAIELTVKKGTARCDFHTSTINAATRGSKSCKKAQCKYKTAYMAPTALANCRASSRADSDGFSNLGSYWQRCLRQSLRGSRKKVAAAKSTAKSSTATTAPQPPRSSVQPCSAQPLSSVKSNAMRTAQPLRYGSKGRRERPSSNASFTPKPSTRRHGAASPARRPRAPSRIKLTKAIRSFNFVQHSNRECIRLWTCPQCAACRQEMVFGKLNQVYF